MLSLLRQPKNSCTGTRALPALSEPVASGGCRAPPSDSTQETGGAETAFLLPLPQATSFRDPLGHGGGDARTESGQQPHASRSCQTVLFQSTRAKKGALARVAVRGGPRSKAKIVEIRLPAIKNSAFVVAA